MLQLLQPIWMFTATAIVMPVVIHLWSLRKGRRLKIGSLSLINESIQPIARQIRITEWLLLLLRCLLILLLALFLSKPYWHNHITGTKNKGWVMMPKESVSTLYPVFKKQVDSLLAAGHEFHHFNFPFEKSSLSASVADSSDHSSYHRRLAQLNERLPAGFPVYLFSGGGMDHFSGNLPVTDLSVTWKLAPPQTETVSLVAAYRFHPDSLSLTFVSSSPDGNYFIQQHIPVATATKDLQVQQTGGTLTVTFQNGTAVPVDTATIHVTVYQKAHKEDAVYITAALEAIRPLLGKKLLVTAATDVSAIPVNQDWIFWLSDELPNTNTQANYFVYARGSVANSDSRIITQNHTPLLYKRIDIKDTGSSKIIWRDGYGLPVLEKKTGSRLYRFYSRFDPSWTNMVWDASFPEMLLTVLEPSAVHENFIDNRQVDTAQLFATSTAPTQKNISGSNTDLSTVCWWLLILCLAAERWVSLRNKTTTRAA